MKSSNGDTTSASRPKPANMGRKSPPIEALDYLHTPLGVVEIGASAGRLERVRFVPVALESHPNSITAQACDSLQAFFRGETIHPLPFACAFASDFSRRVLEELARLKYGETITYSALGERLGGIHPRSIARVMASNRLALLFPCHRVIAKESLGGYSAGASKEAILAWERSLGQK